MYNLDQNVQKAELRFTKRSFEATPTQSGLGSTHSSHRSDNQTDSLLEKDEMPRIAPIQNPQDPQDKENNPPPPPKKASTTIKPLVRRTRSNNQNFGDEKV